MKRISASSLATLALVFSGLASAADDGEGKRERRGPPPEAVEACAAGVEGDSCSFEGRRGDTLEGTCFQPQEAELACRPEGGRHGLKMRENYAEQEETE